MPGRSMHLRFDEILQNNGIVSPDFSKHDREAVHDRMDRDMMDYGGPKYHQDRDPMHNEEGIYDWINHGRGSFWDSIRAQFTGPPTIYDLRLSDFLRVCLGHLVLDQYWAKYGMYAPDKREKDIDEALKMAFQTYRNRGYRERRFRYSDE
jgi:hypothetical protein